MEIDKMYEKYLEITKISEQAMHPSERIERKRAFMAGCAQMFVAITEKCINEKNEDQAIIFLDSLQEEILLFWSKEAGAEGEKLCFPFTKRTDIN